MSRFGLKTMFIGKVVLLSVLLAGYSLVTFENGRSPALLSNLGVNLTTTSWQFLYQQHITKSFPHFKRARPRKKIMLWTDFFASPKWYYPFPVDQKTIEISCSETRYKCVLSYDRTNPQDYDAIVFHSRNVGAQSPIPDQLKRRPDQVYIMHLWESPIHNGGSHEGATFYNWSSTYSPDSTITSRHRISGKLAIQDKHAMEKIPQLQNKRPDGTPTVLWIVSNCRSSGRRHLYFDVFKKHIQVDLFGGCGKRCPQATGGNNQNCYDLLSKTGHYKFYLAWENSFCKDYISFKPFRALNSSLVPVVMGGLTAVEYKYLFPPNSYIDVRNFTSPKALADYLIYLDKNDEAYKAYHAWRKDYWITASFEPLFCKYCEALNNQTMMSQHRNVDWRAHWNTKNCDNKMVEKLLAPLQSNMPKTTVGLKST